MIKGAKKLLTIDPTDTDYVDVDLRLNAGETISFHQVTINQILVQPQSSQVLNDNKIRIFFEVPMDWQGNQIFEDGVDCLVTVYAEVGDPFRALERNYYIEVKQPFVFQVGGVLENFPGSDIEHRVQVMEAEVAEFPNHGLSFLAIEKPTPSEVIAGGIVPHGITCNVNNCIARALTAPTNDCTIKIFRNQNNQIGTIFFPAGQQAGVISFTNILTGILPEGELITFVAPLIPDATIANIAVLLR